MRPINILFVQLGFHEDFPDVSKLATTYSDGIYYVASYVQRHCPGARIDMCQMLWDEDPAGFPIESYDYIMISALASQFWSNIPVLELLKSRKKPGCKIIIGGAHATFAPYEVLEYANYAILGEGEVPSVQLIRRLESGGDLREVDNLCYLEEDGSLVLNKSIHYGNLNNIINPGFLRRAPRLHWATLSMSRGCPYDCSFCYGVRIQGRRFRTKDVRDIQREINGIHGETGCTRFYVTDLNFTTRKDFCRSVAAAVREQNYKFIAMSRIEIADDSEFLVEMRDAGFQEYCLGVESDSADVLTAFNKRVDPCQQTARLQKFAGHNIYIHSAIIFGLEYQDRSAVEQTARWCADARIVHPTFVCLAEYPFQDLIYGFRGDIEDYRIIMNIPTYQHYSFVGFLPRHMRPSELQRSIIKSYDIFFQRAFELETRPQRRMRLKAYARSIEYSIPGMQKHILFLEKFEKPYYTASGHLREEVLKSDFEARYGGLREWLENSLKEHSQSPRECSK